MARKRAENRERSLGFPGFVKPVFTKDIVWDIINVDVKEQGTEQGTLGTPCRNRVFEGKGVVNSNSEGTISEIGVNKVNQWGWNFIGYKLESESINPNTVKSFLDDGLLSELH
ncbi:hypothetical protein TNCV_2888951 [Trichonephila clavipes]|nr:hypothetical protein TNCV_2888951 [Trichonephila clavipes]